MSWQWLMRRNPRSAEHSWLIDDLNDFNVFSVHPTKWAVGVCTRLETDLDLAGTTFVAAPIAMDANGDAEGTRGSVFAGTFDGNRHVIRNLTIDVGNAGTDYLGLFGQIDAGGTVQRLGLENVNISSWNYVQCAGGTGKTTSEMKQQQTFTTANWDFYDETANGINDVWAMSFSDGYPVFYDSNTYHSAVAQQYGLYTTEWDVRQALAADTELQAALGLHTEAALRNAHTGSVAFVWHSYQSDYAEQNLTVQASTDLGFVTNSPDWQNSVIHQVIGTNCLGKCFLRIAFED